MEQRSGEVLVDEVHASEAELLRRTANHLDGAQVIELFEEPGLPPSCSCRRPTWDLWTLGPESGG